MAILCWDAKNSLRGTPLNIVIMLFNIIFIPLHINSIPGGYIKVHWVAAISLLSLLAGSRSGHQPPRIARKNNVASKPKFPLSNEECRLHFIRWKEKRLGWMIYGLMGGEGRLCFIRKFSDVEKYFRKLSFWNNKFAKQILLSQIFLKSYKGFSVVAVETLVRV